MTKAKRIFGSFIAPFERQALGNSNTAAIYGLSIFVPRFLQALLRYSDFDEFHFFSRGPDRPLQEGEFLSSDPRIRLFRLNEFRTCASDRSYNVFHSPWGPDIGSWIDLRNRLSPRSIPISGMIHTVSYQNFLPRLLATAMLGPEPSDSIVCTSECGRIAMQNWMGHLSREFGAHIGRPVEFRGRFDVIPIGIDTEQFRPQPKAEVRQRLHIPMDRIVLLYFGRFSAYDKMDLTPLLIAFKQASQKLARPPLLILAGAEGEFGYVEEITRIVGDMGLKDAVVIRKNVPGEDAGALYAAADVFVSPSDNVQETFGQSVVEAMASGLPVVGSDWDGYRETIVHGKTGFRIPTYWMQCDTELSDFAGVSDWLFNHFALAQSVCVDVGGMTDAIEQLVSNAALRSEMGEFARQRAVSLYDWKVVIRQYLDLWDELNRIADHNTTYSTKPVTWFRPNLFKTFEHYCTRVLAGSTVVRTLDASFLDAPDVLISAHDKLLQFDLLRKIVGCAGKALPIRRLQECVTAEMVCREDDFRLHVLWLLKYGALSVQ